jgi:mRNA interferase RelE/StbE
MSTFVVILTPEAQADVKRLDPAPRARILDKLAWMGDHAELLRQEILRGEEWRGCLQYRLGDYRIIYRVDRPDAKLIVLKVGHRREVYRS